MHLIIQTADKALSVHRAKHTHRSDGRRSRIFDDIILSTGILRGVLPDLLTSRLRLHQEPQEARNRCQEAKMPFFFFSLCAASILLFGLAVLAAYPCSRPTGHLYCASSSSLV